MNFLFFTLLFSIAQAGYLRITSESNIELDQKGRSFELRGTYTIQNQGNEGAKQVWPEFRLDKYHLRGSARDLEPGESHTWEFKERFTDRELCLQASSQCPLGFPAKGQFLIRVFKNYQDQNGYLFSIPEVLITASPHEKDTNQLDMTLRLAPARAKEFEAEISFKNESNQDLKVLSSWMLPREVDVLTDPRVLEVPTHQSVAGKFSFRNRSALPGSSYVAIAIAEWTEGDERKASFQVKPFQVEKAEGMVRLLKKDKAVWAWTLWSVCLGLLFMWAFWIRPLKKLSK